MVQREGSRDRSRCEPPLLRHRAVRGTRRDRPILITSAHWLSQATTSSQAAESVTVMRTGWPRDRRRSSRRCSSSIVRGRPWRSSACSRTRGRGSLAEGLHPPLPVAGPQRIHHLADELARGGPPRLDAAALQDLPQRRCLAGSGWPHQAEGSLLRTAEATPDRGPALVRRLPPRGHRAIIGGFGPELSVGAATVPAG